MLSVSAYTEQDHGASPPSSPRQMALAVATSDEHSGVDWSRVGGADTKSICMLELQNKITETDFPPEYAAPFKYLVSGHASGEVVIWSIQHSKNHKVESFKLNSAIACVCATADDDGTPYVVCCNDENRKITVYNCATKSTYEVDQHTGAVRHVWMCPRHKITLRQLWVFSCSYDNSIAFFDLTTRKTVGKVPATTLQSVSCVTTCYARDGHDEKLFILAGLEDGKLARYVFCPLMAQKSLNNINRSSSSRSFGASQMFTASAWDETKLIAHTDSINDICVFDYTPPTCDSINVVANRKMLLSASEDKNIIMWDILRAKPLRTFKGHTKEVQCVMVSNFNYANRSEMVILSGSWDHTVKMWSINTGDCLKTITSQEPVETFTQYKHKMYENNLIYVEGNYFRQNKIEAHLSCYSSMTTFKEKISAFCIGLRNEDCYNTSFVSKGANIVATTDGKDLRFIGTINSVVTQLCFSKIYNVDTKKQMDIIVSLDHDSVIVWDAGTGRVKIRIEHSVDDVGKFEAVSICAAHFPDEQSFVICGGGSGFRIYDINTGLELKLRESEKRAAKFESIKTLTCISNYVDGFSLSVVCGGRNDGSLQLFHLELVQDIPLQENNMALGGPMRYLPRGRAMSMSRITVTYTGFKIAQKPQIIKGHQNPVTCVDMCVHPEKRSVLIYSGSGDGTVRICEPKTEKSGEQPFFKESAVLQTNHPFKVTSICMMVRESELFIVVGGENCGVYVWNVSSGGGKMVRRLLGHELPVQHVFVGTVSVEGIMKRQVDADLCPDTAEVTIISSDNHCTKNWTLEAGMPSENDMKLAFEHDRANAPSNEEDYDEGYGSDDDDDEDSFDEKPIIVQFPCFRQLIAQHENDLNASDAANEIELNTNNMDEEDVQKEAMSRCLSVYGSNFFVMALNHKLWCFVDEFLPMCPNILLREAIMNLEYSAKRVDQGADASNQQQGGNSVFDCCQAYDGLDDNETLTSVARTTGITSALEMFYSQYTMRRTRETVSDTHCSLLYLAIKQDKAKTVRVVLDAWLSLLNTPPVDAFAQIYLPCFCFPQSDLLFLADRLPSEFEYFMCKIKILPAHSDILGVDNYSTLLLRSREVRFAGVDSIESSFGLWNNPHEDMSTDWMVYYFGVYLKDVTTKSSLVDTYFHPLSYCSHEMLLLACQDACVKLNRNTIFGSQSTQLALKFLWKKFGRKHHWSSFWKYIAYLFTLLVSSALFGYVQCENPGTMSHLWSGGYCGLPFYLFVFTSQLAILFFTFVMFLEETFQYHYGKADKGTYDNLVRHFSDLWNFMDLIWLFCIFVGTLIRLVLRFETNTSRCMLALGIVFVWAKFLYFLRAFPSTGYLVALVVRISSDIKPFLKIIGVIVIGFAHAFWVLNNNLEHPSMPFATFPSSLLRSFAFMVGEFTYEDFQDSQVENFTLALSSVYMALVAILLVNLLIALMGNSYELVMNQAKSQFYWEVSSAIADQMYLRGEEDIRSAEPIVVHVLMARDALSDSDNMNDLFLGDSKGDIDSKKIQLLEEELKSANRRNCSLQKELLRQNARHESMMSKLLSRFSLEDDIPT